MLDALTYGGNSEGGPLLAVTTRSLLDKWLAARSREKLPELNVSADLQTALGQTISSLSRSATTPPSRETPISR